MPKWLSKDDPRAQRASLPDPIRIEKKMVHGQLVDVKIYAPSSSSVEIMEVGSPDRKTITTIHQIFGDRLSQIWTGDMDFELKNI